MQIFQIWPDTIEGIPKSLESQLKSHLIEPFENDEHVAQEYWQQCLSTLIILDAEDSISAMNEESKKLIKFARDYLEYQDALTDEYQINLSIVDDEGAGLYLVYPNGFDFSELQKESASER